MLQEKIPMPPPDAYDMHYANDRRTTTSRQHVPAHTHGLIHTQLGGETQSEGLWSKAEHKTLAHAQR